MTIRCELCGKFISANELLSDNVDSLLDRTSDGEVKGCYYEHKSCQEKDDK